MCRGPVCFGLNAERISEKNPSCFLAVTPACRTVLMKAKLACSHIRLLVEGKCDFFFFYLSLPVNKCDKSRFCGPGETILAYCYFN